MVSVIDGPAEYVRRLADVFARGDVAECYLFMERHGFQVPSHPITMQLMICKIQYNTPGVPQDVRAAAKAWCDKWKFSTSID